jgi:hypothetical protein
MDIVYADFSHPSFNWANGLYIVVSKDLEEGVYNLCRIEDDGQPQLDYKGEFSISCTGLNNPGVKKTNLKYFTDQELRKEKLKKINQNGQ